MPKLVITSKGFLKSTRTILSLFIYFYLYFFNPLGKLYLFVVTAVNPTTFVYQYDDSHAIRLSEFVIMYLLLFLEEFKLKQYFKQNFLTEMW